METLDELKKPREQRPVFLTVLCILTFIMSGFSFLGLIVSAVKGPDSPDEIEKAVATSMKMVTELEESGAGNFARLLEKIAHFPEYTNAAFYQLLAANFVVLLLGFTGALLMWLGRKIGFHSYILYNIAGILSIYIAVPVSEVPSIIVILQVVFSAIFVFMYSRNLRWLK